MPTLLVNADDFGLHRDMDRGILECIDAGVLQSLSFCPQGRSLDWGQLGQLQQRGVRVGLHLTLVGEPWGTDGRVISRWPQLVQRVLMGGAELRAAVNREADWQIRRCIDHGIRPDHIDSHQHVHVFAGIWPIARRIQAEHNIPRIRVPHCPSLKLIKKNLPGLALQTLATQRALAVSRYLPCIGLSYAGQNTIDVLLRELRVAMRSGRDLEAVMHPGVSTPELQRHYEAWRFDWTAERDALLDPRLRAALTAGGYTFASTVR